MIKVENLHRHFGGFRAVDGASLEIRSGSITGLIGPNGAGKTTLFNLVAGTVRPDKGLVLFKGDDISNTGAADRCKLGISRSFQVPHPFNGMTVFENILVGAAFGRAAGSTAVELTNRATSIKTLEWERIHEMLAETGFNISETARRLGMHRRTLARKLDKQVVK